MVKRIFEEYIGGKSLNDIKRGLERDHIKIIIGNLKWSSSSISCILKNEKYYGDSNFQKTITQDHLTKKRKLNGEKN